MTLKHHPNNYRQVYTFHILQYRETIKVKMPRTKQPKMSKKAKKQNANNSHSMSGTSSHRSRKEIITSMEAEGEQAIKSYEEGALQEIKNMELRTKLLVNSKEPFLKKTLQDFVDIALKGAEAGSEFSIALKACLDGTYVPPPTPGADGNKTGSSAPSVCGSMMSCTSGSRRPPSSASSVRSLYSSHGNNLI
ncbi:uncharacterized protein LOC103522337 isoform X1 [Diaphorina citri]|uniref:Uncharacterized protein LOC103522337 isoform X1 n=2 Tax=Diaphorina citri TaxID=121845 RepID=A0A3Q0JIY0_DIACI|nr:uncharacterized protein LOC103522337 isoform X1 [Diaphorina citri]XP_026688340.1 uncharacterized protein LOC103522337 isoform X1 [Diaphorina citri]